MDDDLLNGLRAAGAADSEGTFSIDVQAARRKMGAWRLEHPDLWMLGPLMVAVAAEATRMRVSYQARAECAEFEFDGRPVPAAWLNGLLHGRDIGQDDYALALTEAFELAVAVGVRGFKVVTSKRRQKGTPSHILITPPRSDWDYEKAVGVYARCVYAPLDIAIDEMVVPTRVITEPLAVAVVTTESDRPGTRFRIDFEHVLKPVRKVAGGGLFSAVLSLTANTGAVTCVRNGVSFPVWAELLGVPNVQCVAASPLLMPDLSLGHVVQDEAFQDMMACLRREAAELVLAFAEDDVPLPKTLFVLDVCAAICRTPQIEEPLRARTAGVLMRRLARCIDWSEVDPILTRWAAGLTVGPDDEGERRMLAAVKSDRDVHSFVLEQLARLLAVIGRAGEGLGVLSKLGDLSAGEDAPDLDKMLAQRHLLALVLRAGGQLERGETLHRSILEEASQPGVIMRAHIHLGWCALARGDYGEAIHICGPDRPSAPVSLRTQRLEVKAEALRGAGEMDAAVDALRTAALLAVEHGTDDAVELAVAWRRFRILRHDGCGLGDGWLDRAQTLASRFMKRSGWTQQLFDLARTSNAWKELHEAERESAAGLHQAALLRYQGCLMKMRSGDGMTLPPNWHGLILRRIDAVQRILGRGREADETRARCALLLGR